mmetsp:Transcript_25371/g.66582  ORF Transcript_25371/g.66582 Transcript_25371/m.66582 type:complete len:192 (+) Transcript_25371:2-577(+)
MASLAALWFVPTSYRYLTWFTVFLIGFFIYGPQMLIGLAGAEIVDRRAVSSTIGLLGWIAYLGASVAGFPLTKIVAHLGWPYYIASLIAMSGIAVLLLLPLWRTGAPREAVKAIPGGEEGAELGPAVEGLAPGTVARSCDTCAGTGEVIRLDCLPATPAQVSCKYLEVVCPYCAGKGYVIEQSREGLMPMT